MLNIFFHILLVTVFILLIPFIAMQFTDEVNWSVVDFIIMGILIFSNGLLINLVLKKFGKYRMPAVIVILILFLYIWAELAVGIFTKSGS